MFPSLFIPKTEAKGPAESHRLTAQEVGCDQGRHPVELRRHPSRCGKKRIVQNQQMMGEPTLTKQPSSRFASHPLTAFPCARAGSLPPTRHASSPAQRSQERPHALSTHHEHHRYFHISKTCLSELIHGAMTRNACNQTASSRHSALARLEHVSTARNPHSAQGRDTF